MKYTTSKEADKKIQEDVEVICKEIRREIPEILSIILTGSFSRGEGPVKIQDGKIFPYNDYDIQIICRKKITKKKIDKISIDISKKLGYRGIINFYPFKKEEQKMKENFYIDLKCDNPSDLRNLLPRIRTYELRNHSLLLYGKDFRNLIPDYNLKDTPLSEGAKLLLDRMSQMIEYYSGDGKYEKDFLTYIIQQAYAACCTSLLLLSGKYQIGYKKSMEIFKKTYKKDFFKLYKKVPDLDKKIEQFNKWKINPKKLPFKDIEGEWFIAKKNILEVSKYFFSIFLKKEIKDYEDLANSISDMRTKFYHPYLNAILKNRFKINFGKLSVIPIRIVTLLFKYKYYKRLKKFGIAAFFPPGKSPDLVIFSSLIYLIDSIEKRKVDKAKLEKGRRILNKIYPCEGKNWEGVSIDYANAYIAFFLQKI